MKINWNIIKFILLSIFVVFLYAFASKRNASRLVSNPKITFVGENKLFLTEENVSKLLIQNNESVTNMPKEILDLNVLETALNKNQLIASAQVYLTVQGELVAEVKQKKPVARVLGATSYYIDTEGKYMPLSQNHAERVPIVTGSVYKTDLNDVYTLAKKVSEDAFLKEHVVEIQQTENKRLYLKLRGHNFKVHLGTLKQLDKKVNNLKVFYKQAQKQKKLDTYSILNLQFDNQVVCTKS